MSRHNSSRRRRAAVGERWVYSVEALVLLWAGSAAVGVMVGAVVWLVWQ